MIVLFRISAASSSCEKCINILDKEQKYPVHEFQRTSDILHLAGADWVSKFKGDVSKVKSGKPGRRRKWKKSGPVPDKSPQTSKTRSLAQKKKRSLCKQACRIRQASMEDRSHMFVQKAKKELKELFSARHKLRSPVTDTQTPTESKGSANKDIDTVKAKTPQKKTPPSPRRYVNHIRMGNAKEDDNLSKVNLQ